MNTRLATPQGIARQPQLPMPIPFESALSAALCVGHFVPPRQARLLLDMAGNGQEEAQHFREILVELTQRIRNLPETGAQDGLGENAIAHLHYFTGGTDIYLTERDIEDEQTQAFGQVNSGYGPEWGYISLVEMFEVPQLELDLYFEPTPLSKINNKGVASAPGAGA